MSVEHKGKIDDTVIGTAISDSDGGYVLVELNSHDLLWALRQLRQKVNDK